MTARFRAAGLVLAVLAAGAAGQAQTDAAPSSLARSPGRWRDASIEDYRNHIVALQGLTRACAKARDLKTCDPALVGPDDRVPLSAPSSTEHRLIRYGWLRILFSRAEEPDAAERAPDPSLRSPQARQSLRETPPTTSQLLVDAETRLAHDLAEAGSGAQPRPSYATERDTMTRVLAGREFRSLEQATEADTALERFGNWLNRIFAKVDRLRARSAWIGQVLVWGFFAAVAVALAWGLLRLERRWRVRLVPPSEAPLPGAASARDWQLWLKDAGEAAAGARWREAIHFLYWAAISRLESRRLWPADRARTPREYLALVAPDDPRQSRLAFLTNSFERTWYGGRDASESDYRRAEALARGLISGDPVAEGAAQ